MIGSDTYSARLVLVKTYKRKDGKFPVILRVGINGAQKRFATKILIPEKDWNERLQQVRKGHPEYNDLNMRLGNFLAVANEIFNEYRWAKISLTLDMFSQAFSNPASRQDFLVFMDVKIKLRLERGQITKSTSKQHFVVLNKLKRYKSKIRFVEISNTILEDFDLWHVGELRKKMGKRLVNDGEGPRSNAMKIIKTYLRLAKKDRIEFQMPISFETSQNPPIAPHLLASEVQKLINIFRDSENYPAHWRPILRMFLWCCFTGQSYVDAKNCRWEKNIRGDTLYYLRQKTAKNPVPVTVPLPAIALEIIGSPEKEGFVFRQYSDGGTAQNRELKLIAKACDISVKLSWKVGRDTFATLFLEECPGDILTLASLMGHRRIETTRKYVHLSPSHKNSQVSKAFSRFEMY